MGADRRASCNLYLIATWQKQLDECKILKLKAAEVDSLYNKMFNRKVRVYFIYIETGSQTLLIGNLTFISFSYDS